MRAGRLIKKTLKILKNPKKPQYNVNVNVNVNVKEKEKENAGDIKKEKNFLFAGDCVNDFFNVFNG